ncbi:MAG: hypothetical protein WC462_00895 [archaeon]
MGQKAQSSLEYLLLLAAFFAVLGLVLPVISNTTQSFLSAEDDLLAKHIYEEVQEQVNLMSFLGNGSVKQLEFVPAKFITLYSSGNDLFIESENKKFSVVFPSPPLIPKQEFSGKFLIRILKNKNDVQVFVVQS